MAVKEAPQIMSITGFKGWDWIYTITWSISMGFGWAFHAHMWLRMYTPSREKDSRIWPGIILGENMINGILLFVAMSVVIVAAPGLVPDLAFLSTVGTLLPTVLFGLILAGAAGAMFSTIDSQAHAVGLLVSHDFVENMGRKKLSDRGFIWLNRYTILAVVGAGYLLAFLFPGPLGILAIYPSSIGFILLPTVIAAVTGQKWVTKEGIFAGLIAGFITMFATAMGPLKNLLHVHFGMWGVIVNIIVLIIVSMLTPTRPDEKRIKEIKQAGW